ncbi:MAG: hypothetical protein J6328_03625 [Bacilli bacterium]|nr:hypothetical protein [Bacilli bacterium]
MHDHEALKDEELLLLQRLGDKEAETALMVRYFRRRYRHAKRAADYLYMSFTPEDFLAVYLSSFTQCVNSYRFGISRFQNYFELILQRDMVKEAAKPEIKEALNDSMDKQINEFDEHSLTLHDVIADDTPVNDPKVYIDYAETLESLHKLPRYLSSRGLKLIKMRSDGFSLKESCLKLKITRGQARNIMLHFQRFMAECLSHPKKPPYRLKVGKRPILRIE